MKIINSVVVVGLYYGFMTTFSIGPSYLFLLRAQVMEKRTENKISATTGFITGQLVMFMSIYYAPLHLALNRPHTITVLALPYFLFHFFWNNHKHFFDFYYGSTTRNPMRNFSIQCVFLNNFIFQLFNHFILPSSMLVRLINIYMFRCNNKMLFLISSFFGWLIVQILFMKWLGLVLAWLRKNHLRSNRYRVSEFLNSMARFFNILLFIICVYYLGRMPSPIFTKKFKETPKVEHETESDGERDVEIASQMNQMKWTKQEQEEEEFTKEDPFPSFFSEEKADTNKINEMEEIQVNGKEDEFNLRFTETGYKKRPVTEESCLININENHNLKIFDKKTDKDKKDPFFEEKPLINLLFDPKRWNRPSRYIKNTNSNGTVRNEMSQYFFNICESDGKERMSFTYLPSLSVFFEMIKRKISPVIFEKSSPNKLSNFWLYTNKHFSNEFINRLEALDKELISLNILETRTRLCNDDYTKEYLSKRYDPLLNRSYRKTIYKNLSPPILKKTLIENFIEKFGINRIHGLLISDTNYQEQEFEQKINKYEKKPLLTKIIDLLTLISRVVRESGSNNLNCKVLFLFSEKKIGIKIFKYLLTQIVTDINDQKIFKKSTRINEISKKFFRRSYKLITELEQETEEYQEGLPADHQIRSRKHKNIVIFTINNEDDTDPNPNTDTNDQIDDQTDNEIYLTRYSKKSDFRRGIIKGSMRSQRRKIVFFEMFQANAHSPLYLDRLKKNYFFSFNTSGLRKLIGLIKLIFRKRTGKGEAFKILDYREEQPKREEKKEKNKRSENARKKISETWKAIPCAQGARSFLLLTQSFLRKYIILPFFIIAKNIGRILLFQLPEWSEDFQELNKEVHIKCTYHGVPVPENEFPKNWLTDGIQIKIVFPFCLKPWNKSKDLMKKKKKRKDDCFLTVWGMEAELPFGSPRKQLPFFKPIFTELNKKIGQLKKKCFQVLKEKTKIFLKLSKVNPIRLKKVKIYESRKLKKEKDSLVSNQIIHESLSTISPTNWTNSSFTEKKIMDLINRKNEILNQIQRISKEKKKVTTKINNLISANKINYNNKRLKKWKILKRRNVRIIYKLLLFLKFFIERIYTDIFLYSINILKMNTELFLKLKKEKFYQLIYNNKKKQRIINKKKKNLTPFISKLLYNISKKNSYTFSDLDLSYVSQAYVFYKLAQIQVSNSSNLKYVLHYQEIPLFLKPEIKDSFDIQRIVHSLLGDKKLPSYEINQWKSWLREHYQYNLSQIKWSRLIPEKWRNKVFQHYIVKKEILNKRNSYEKDLLIDYKKQKEFEVCSLSNKKKIQKNYRYDLLSYKFLNYENKMEYRFSFQEKKNQESYYMSKKTLFYTLKNISIPINNYINNYINNNLVRAEIPYMEKTADSKYFDWKILNFYLRQNIDIKASIMIDTKRNQNTQILTNNSQIILKKNLSSIISEKNPPNSKKGFFDWMRMNEKMLKHPISNLESWFFPEFVLLYNAYKMKPWFIPSKLLLLNLNRNKILNLNRNKKEKELTSRGDLGSPFLQQKQQKNMKENSVRSDMEKGINKKKKNAYLDLFAKRYFLFQLRYIYHSFNKRMINNIRIYSFLLRLKDTKEFTISSVQKKEINLAIMPIHNMSLTLKKFIKSGVLIIEPLRLSVKKDGQFIMYQTIGVSLIHKNKYQTKQKYQEQKYVSNNNFDETISTHQRIIENQYKNSFDLLVLENILSFRQRRKLRIIICLNSKNRDHIDLNPLFCKEKSIKNNIQVSHNNKHFDREKNQLMKLKLFLWPNYRLEDLACMNRYWFDTNNGSRFSTLRVHLYPQLKI